MLYANTNATHYAESRAFKDRQNIGVIMQMEQLDHFYLYFKALHEDADLKETSSFPPMYVGDYEDLENMRTDQCHFTFIRQSTFLIFQDRDYESNALHTESKIAGARVTVPSIYITFPDNVRIKAGLIEACPRGTETPAFLDAFESSDTMRESRKITITLNIKRFLDLYAKWVEEDPKIKAFVSFIRPGRVHDISTAVQIRKRYSPLGYITSRMANNCVDAVKEKLGALLLQGVVNKICQFAYDLTCDAPIERNPHQIQLNFYYIIIAYTAVTGLDTLYGATPGGMAKIVVSHLYHAIMERTPRQDKENMKQLLMRREMVNDNLMGLTLKRRDTRLISFGILSAEKKDGFTLGMVPLEISAVKLTTAPPLCELAAQAVAQAEAEAAEAKVAAAGAWAAAHGMCLSTGAAAAAAAEKARVAGEVQQAAVAATVNSAQRAVAAMSTAAMWAPHIEPPRPTTQPLEKPPPTVQPRNSAVYKPPLDVRTLPTYSAGTVGQLQAAADDLQHAVTDYTLKRKREDAWAKPKTPLDAQSESSGDEMQGCGGFMDAAKTLEQMKTGAEQARARRMETDPLYCDYTQNTLDDVLMEHLQLADDDEFVESFQRAFAGVSVERGIDLLRKYAECTDYGGDALYRLEKVAQTRKAVAEADARLTKSRQLKNRQSKAVAHRSAIVAMTSRSAVRDSTYISGQGPRSRFVDFAKNIRCTLPECATREELRSYLQRDRMYAPYGSSAYDVVTWRGVAIACGAWRKTRAIDKNTQGTATMCSMSVAELSQFEKMQVMPVRDAVKFTKRVYKALKNAVRDLYTRNCWVPNGHTTPTDPSKEPFESVWMAWYTNIDSAYTPGWLAPPQ